MNSLSDILNTFEPITLEEMDTVKLMNRIDTKFVFHASKLPAILEELKKNYRVLEMAGTRSTRYESVYFDLPDHDLYLQHHNGKSNRVKIRCRRYVDSETCFFEIKKKNNKGRTVKARVKTAGICEDITGKAKMLLGETTGIPAESLRPSLRVFFSRSTFVDKNMTERLTIDCDLLFRNGNADTTFQNLIIAELKQERSSRSIFRDILHRHHIADFRISKYCLGIISLNKNIKQNNFKSKLIQLNKIVHECN